MRIEATRSSQKTNSIELPDQLDRVSVTRSSQTLELQRRPFLLSNSTTNSIESLQLDRVRTSRTQLVQDNKSNLNANDNNTKPSLKGTFPTLHLYPNLSRQALITITTHRHKGTC
jgi:hypothetical protein